MTLCSPESPLRAGHVQVSIGPCGDDVQREHIRKLPGVGETHHVGLSQETRGVWPGWWVLFTAGFCSAEQMRNLGQGRSCCGQMAERGCEAQGPPPPPLALRH